MNKKTMQNNKKNNTILAMDGGGTNFVFASIGADFNIENRFNISIKNMRNDLTRILDSIAASFDRLDKNTYGKPVAISLGFPGPIDAEKGIVGDLDNIPAFRGGVALGPMLEKYFQIPVFLNNDGDLFALGEAINGFLPEINKKLGENSSRQYNNLIGVTFGTGFGGGIIRDGVIIRGDNSASGEINRFRNKLYPKSSVEESVSIRGLKRVYAREAKLTSAEISNSYDIYRIAKGEKKGDKDAAIKAFEELAIVAGDAIASAISLFDANVVIGGGIAGAYELFLAKLVEEINSHYIQQDGTDLPRTEVKAYNLEDEKDTAEFLGEDKIEIKIPQSKEKVYYDKTKKVGVGITKLGTDKAIFTGAYYTALQKLR